MLILYLDAATAGILLQVVLGGVAGGLVVVTIFWRRLLSLVARTKHLVGGKSYEPESPGC